MFAAKVVGTTVDAAQVTRAADYVVVAKRSPPNQLVTAYLFHYLAAGTVEECECHSQRHALHIQAPALLTYKVLRPRRQKLDDWRTDSLERVPGRPPEVLADDEDVVIWAVETGS